VVWNLVNEGTTPRSLLEHRINIGNTAGQLVFAPFLCSQGAEPASWATIRFDLGTNSLGFAVWRTGPDPSGAFGADGPRELLWSRGSSFKMGAIPRTQTVARDDATHSQQARKRRRPFRIAGAPSHSGSHRSRLDCRRIRRSEKRWRRWTLRRCAPAALSRTFKPHEDRPARSSSHQRRGSNPIARPTRATRTRASSPRLRKTSADAYESTIAAPSRIPVDAPSRPAHDPRRIPRPGRPATAFAWRARGRRLSRNSYRLAT